MSARAAPQGVRATSYARLAEARAQAASLIRTRDAQRVRAALAQIVRLAKRTLDEASGIAGPGLISHAWMQMAAALFDLAALERDGARRAQLIAAGTRACDTGIRVALASKAAFLALKVLPWAMVVLAGGLRASRDGHSARLQRLMASCAKALPVLDAYAKREGRAAAGALFQAQAIALATERVTDAAGRTAVLRRARDLAHDARARAIRAGAFGTARQAERAAATIDERMRAPAPGPASQAPRPAAPPPVAEAPATARPFPKFCPTCGTPTKQGAKFCASCGTKLG